MQQFRALVLEQEGERIAANIRTRTLADLPAGEVTIRVQYSSVNYKDGLAATINGGVVKSYPLVPGIDLAGTVAESSDSRFRSGDKVVVTGYGTGVSHDGGYSEYARVPADWVVPLPAGLSVREAMVLGTAGFTAALSVHKLEHNGLRPDSGPVLVTGATGGVGSLAVGMLAKLGYEVVASTGKQTERDYLRKLGASGIISREELTPERIRPLDKQRWAGAVDPVGGKSLAYVLSALRYGGSVAVSGLTGGTEVPATVLPFILRGVSLIGIDSVECPMDVRLKVWERLAGDLYLGQFLEESIDREIDLDEVPTALADIMQAKMRGRALVKL
ncbi:acryloyl-CoA reductase [Paenibacillus thalictri]|uniref:Acryloyl-CoA reductase n=1 Tax=Paenibacillus thalictri TaxID=2527873 RepID=A0A4Q9DLZ8_9BACL|nr:acryloyl-CoA reductase [Paenibacillus thalictri]TBL73975.1 acryloyl-CoA reductase [Paenibacillus thalictri]